MTNERNPQAEQMADESMVRGLAAQAQAIWPQEQELFRRYDLAPDAAILDVGCGTGEITSRLAGLFSEARLTGVDLIEEHLVLARERCADEGDRVGFQAGDAFALDFPDASFDLTVCRHLLQAIPDIDRVLAELVRVTRPGGRLHLLAEDYGMMHFAPVDVDTDEFWRRGPMTFAERTGTDLRSGRKLHAHLLGAGLVDVRVDYIVVDTIRVPRRVFADIWIAWRDGYSEAIGERTELSVEEARAAFQTMIDALENPEGYGVWQVPVWTGRKQ